MIWERLVAEGYNVVPTDEKRPLGGAYAACYDKHCPELAERFESKKIKKMQTGVALLGRINPEYPQWVLAIIDVDDPARFPDEARELLRGTWHWRTGPRCPRDGEKHDIKCENGVCRHGDHEFPLSEAPRGEAYAVLIPAEAERLFNKGVVKALDGAVEIKLRAQQQIPPSLHPSGVIYEWITPPYGDDGEVKHPRKLSLEEVRRLLELLGVSQQQQVVADETQQVRTAVRTQERWRRLEERVKAEIAALLRDIYTPGNRQALWLSVSGWLAKARVDPRDAADILLRLYRETNDEDDLKMRGSAIVYTYAKVGYPDAKAAVAEVLGVTPYSPEEAAQKEVKGLSGIREIAASTVGADLAGKLVKRLKLLLRRRRLPVDFDLSQLPQWAWQLDIRLRRVCLEHNALYGFCAKELRVVKDPASQYVDVVLVHRARKCETTDAGRECRIVTAKVSRAARLLRFMGRVYDPYYHEARYIALKDGRVAAVASADDFDSFIEQIRQTPPCFIIKDEKILDILKAYMPQAVLPLSAGLADDGFIDPHGVLDLNDYGAEGTLLQAWRWMKKAYRGRNLAYAVFNVFAALAKVMTPLLRRTSRTFVDNIVYNVGRGGEGKSTLVRYILTPLLGGDEAQETYYIRVDGPVRTEAQLRNLVDMNRLPLLLDEQTRRALMNNAAMFLAAAVGAGVTGIHASRHGHGVAARFRNLRGIIVFTNVPLSTFLRDVAVEASDVAFARRFIEIRWDFERPSPAAFDELLEVKPALGFAVRLWSRYKDELIKSRDLLELVEKLADVLVREYPNNVEVAEMAAAVKQTVSELREEKRAEMAALSDEATLVERAYRVAMEQLKASQLSAIRVLRYILENPHVFHVAFTKLRDESKLREIAEELDDIIAKIKKMYTVRHDSSNTPILADDAAVVVAILEKLIEEKRLQIVLFAKSPLVPGAPSAVLGRRVGVYIDPVTKTRRNGYAVELSTFIKLFLDSATDVSANAEDENPPTQEDQVERVENREKRFTLDTDQTRAGQIGETAVASDSTDVKHKAAFSILNPLNQNFEVPGGQNVQPQSETGTASSTSNENTSTNVNVALDAGQEENKAAGSSAVDAVQKSDEFAGKVPTNKYEARTRYGRDTSLSDNVHGGGAGSGRCVGKVDAVDISEELEELERCGDDEECIARALDAIAKKMECAKKWYE